MRIPLESSFSLRALPPVHALVIGVMALLLAAANWLPANQIVDSDRLAFALTVGLGGLAIVLALRARLTVSDVRAWRNRLALLVVTLAVMGVMAEIGTRWVFRDVTTSADNGGYFSRRWLQSGAIHTNAAGFRGPEFSSAKPPGVYRIVVIGDSFTFGNGIPQEARYSDLLQARLPAHFEVLNFGRPGANTPSHRQRVAILLETAQPDFILVQWYVNDVEGDDTAGRPTLKPLMPNRALHDWLAFHSAFYNIANMRWAEAQITLGMTSSYPDYLHRRLADPNGHDARTDRGHWRDLIARAQNAGVPLGIVLFPDTSRPIDGTYPFGYLHDRVLGQCSEARLTCLDLRKDFSAVRDLRDLWANLLDHHPSARANEIAAERILQTYAATWAASPQK